MPAPARRQIAAAPSDELEPDASAAEPASSMAGGIPVDGGPAIPADGDRREPEDEPADPNAVEVLGPPEPLAAPSVDETVFLLRAAWGIAHHATRLTGGPDDAFQPSAQELRDQAAPLAEIAGRYPWLTFVIRKSPYIAAAVAIGGYAGGELERVADHRRGNVTTSSAAASAARPSPPPPPASAVRSQPDVQDTEYGLGMREAPRPGKAPGVG